MKKIGKVDIIGIPYTIYLYVNEYDKINADAKERDERYGENKHENLDGYCDYSAKELRIFCDKYTSKEYFEETLRHEICHAFLYEIGYEHHSDEEFINKLSKWVPQIDKIFDEGMRRIRYAKY